MANWLWLAWAFAGAAYALVAVAVALALSWDGPYASADTLPLRWAVLVGLAWPLVLVCAPVAVAVESVVWWWRDRRGG